MLLRHKIMLLLIRWKLTSHTRKHKMKFSAEYFTNILLIPWHWLRLKLSSINIPKRPDYIKNSFFLLTYSQCFTTLMMVPIYCGFLSLYTILIAVACAQFQKMKAAILDIRQQHITSHHVQEDEQVHATEYCYMQAKLIAFIRHHQEITE